MAESLARRGAPGTYLLLKHPAIARVIQPRDSQSVARETGPGDRDARSVTLSNDRFSGDRSLLRIAQGRIAALSTRQNGRGGGVSKVQRALVDLGFDLPLFRVDGRFGGETTEAIRQFRERWVGISGDQLDADAMRKLDEVAPAAGARTEHLADYGRLFEDDRLTITVALGHTEEMVAHRLPDDSARETDTPVHELAAERFREWLEGQGFSLELMGFGPNEYWTKQQSFTFTNTEGETETKAITVWLNLITPGAGAAAEFGTGLSESEITIYSGHARYGSGPDFDDKHSPAENFRIGIDAAMRAAGRQTNVETARSHGVAVPDEVALEQLTSGGSFDRSRYRLWFMQACTSMAYLDEVRSLAGGAENLDFVGSRAPTMFTRDADRVGIPEVQTFLEGILAMESIESIVDNMDADQREKYGDRMPRRGVFATEGIGDNPEAP